MDSMMNRALDLSLIICNDGVLVAAARQ
jgi:hypothetical protein